VNREDKTTAIAEIAEEIRESEAIMAVDYRGISVPQRRSCAASCVRLTRLSGSSEQPLPSARLMKPAPGPQGPSEGPTALTFVRGDIAVAAKALASFQKEHELLTFKGGLMGTEVIGADEINALSKLPSRQVLYGQLVGLIASPITGLARSLNGLPGGLAIALSGAGEEAVRRDPGRCGSRTGRGAAPAAEEAPAEEASAPAEAEPAVDPASADEAPADAPSEEPKAEEAAPAADDAPAENTEPQADASADATETNTEADQE